MKNFFKILGVALIAGSMLFVACKKDEENTNNGGNGGNNTPTDTTPTTPTDPVDPPAPTTVMTLNIDGVDYDVDQFQAGYYEGTLYLIPVSTTGGGLQIESAQTVGVHDTNDMGSNWGVCYFPATDDESELYFTYNGTRYPRWENMIGDDVETITAIDLNAHTISMEYSGTMLDCEMYYNQGQQVVLKTTAVNLQNAEWTEVDLSKKAAMKSLRK